MRYTLILLAIFFVLLQSCGGRDIGGKSEGYEGPTMETRNVDLFFSDSAQVRIHMVSPRELIMPNSDRMYPEGIHLDFFDAKGEKTSELTSKKGRYRYDKQLYNVTDSVVVIQLQKHETVLTDELNWLSAEKKIHTDKKVTIKTPDELLEGEGLDAKQDLSWYRILKPTGVFPIETKQQ